MAGLVNGSFEPHLKLTVSRHCEGCCNKNDGDRVFYDQAGAPNVESNRKCCLFFCCFSIKSRRTDVEKAQDRTARHLFKLALEKKYGELGAQIALKSYNVDTESDDILTVRAFKDVKRYARAVNLLSMRKDEDRSLDYGIDSDFNSLKLDCEVEQRDGSTAPFDKEIMAQSIRRLGDGANLEDRDIKRICLLIVSELSVGEDKKLSAAELREKIAYYLKIADFNVSESNFWGIVAPMVVKAINQVIMRKDLSAKDHFILRALAKAQIARTQVVSGEGSSGVQVGAGEDSLQYSTSSSSTSVGNTSTRNEEIQAPYIPPQVAVIQRIGVTM